ncbi:nucleotidyltransferase domain-containing protein, partial [Enterobacter hormaechei]|nr:nucleotidyltransferase domain-containing protein [Enterobacter hormaechei]
MAVDRNGYITRPRHHGIQPEYSHLIANVISILNDDFPDRIHSLYVYGSVAEGKAKPGISDLDITVVFTSDVDPITV